MKQSQPELVWTPVEMVDMSQVSSPQVPDDASESAPPTNPTEAVTSEQPSDTAPSDSGTAIAPFEGESTGSQESESTQLSAEESNSNPTSPTTDLPEDEVQPNGESSQGALPENSQSEDEQSEDNQLEDGDRPVVGTSGSLPDLPGSDGEDYTNPEEFSPTGFTVQLGMIPPDQQIGWIRTDIADQLPTTDTQRSFNSTQECPLSPDVLNQRDSTQIGFRLTIDNTGRVIAVSPVNLTDRTDQNEMQVTENASIDPSYQAFAECVLTQWHFTPALQEGEPVYNNDLVVQLNLTDLLFD
jgi:hypothetical protein